MNVVNNIKDIIMNISMKDNEELENIIYDYIEENDNGVLNEIAQGNRRITINSFKIFMLNHHFNDLEIERFIEFYISVKEFALRSLDCGVMNLNHMLLFQSNYFDDFKFINKCHDKSFKNLVSSIIVIEDLMFTNRKINTREEILSKTEIGKEILKIINY